MSDLPGTSVRIEPQDSGPTTAPRFYRPELDVLRFFAFLCVFLHHGPRLVIGPGTTGGDLVIRKALTLIQEAGAFGMCLFFFLSSFLITELLQRERLKTGTVHLKAFYTRRILRIWPLYFAFVTFCALLAWRLPVYTLHAPRIMAYIFLAGNWYIAVHGVTNSPITPLWSISIEGQFYLLWPLLSKVGGTIGILFGSLILIPVAFFNMYLCASWFHVTTWWNSFIHFFFFAVGGLLALTLKGRLVSFPPLVRCYLFASGLSCWLLSERMTGMKHRVDTVVATVPVSAGYILIAFGCLLIFFAFHGAPSGFFPRWLIYLGKVSFGLYIFHQGSFIIGYLLTLHSARFVFLNQFLIAFAVTVPLAILSYEFFEKPFLRLKERFTFVPSRAA